MHIQEDEVRSSKIMAIQVDDARELVAMADDAKNDDLEYTGDDAPTLDRSMLGNITTVRNKLCTRTANTNTTATTYVSTVRNLYPSLY